MTDNYCVDCFNFKTQTLYRHTIAESRFNVGKIKKCVEKKGRCVVVWCEKTGAYYINSRRTYYLKGCDYYDEA